MNQKQYEREINKAEDAFVEVVQSCYVFFKINTNRTDSEIIAQLQYSVADIIEFTTKKMGARLN